SQDKPCSRSRTYILPCGCFDWLPLYQPSRPTAKKANATNTEHTPAAMAHNLNGACGIHGLNSGNVKSNVGSVLKKAAAKSGRRSTRLMKMQAICAQMTAAIQISAFISEPSSENITGETAPS